MSCRGGVPAHSLDGETSGEWAAGADIEIAEVGSDQQIALIQTSHRDLHLLMQHCLAAGRSATPLGVGHPGVQRTARQAKRTMGPTGRKR